MKQDIQTISQEEKEKEKWIKVSTDFFTDYQSWKDNLRGAHNSRGDLTVYEKGAPIPALSVLKKQILNQSSLHDVGGATDKYR